MPLPQEERRLAIELAVGTARSGIGTGSVPLEDGFYAHGYQGPFDDCCRTLWSLDLAIGIVAEKGEGYREIRFDQFTRADQFPPYFRFGQEAEIRERLAGDPRLDEDVLGQLIRNYLALNCDYASLSVSRDWFTPDHCFVPVLDAFAASGYTETDGTRYRWTTKIAPHMIYRGDWTEDGQDVALLRKAELKAFVTQLPEVERYALLELASKPGSYFFILRRFMDGFEKQGWLQHFPTYGHSPQSITRDFFELIGGDGPR